MIPAPLIVHFAPGTIFKLDGVVIHLIFRTYFFSTFLEMTSPDTKFVLIPNSTSMSKHPRFTPWISF